MIHGAILKRDVRRTVRAVWPWAIVAGLVALGKYFSWRASDMVNVFALLLTGGAAFSAYQSLAAERDEEMLDMLATAPIPMHAVLLEIPLAATCAWTAITLVPVAVLYAATGTDAIGNWLVAVPFALLLAGQASLTTLGFGQGFFTYYAGLAAEAGLLYCLYRACRVSSHGPPESVALNILVLAVLSWAARFELKRLQGVHWPEGALEQRPAGPRTGRWLDRFTFGRVLSTSWWCSVPDGVPALAWRELFRGLPRTVIVGVALMAAMSDQLVVWPACVLVMASFPGCFLVAYLSGSRTAQDRHGPTWSELTVTPGSRLAACSIRVAAPLVHGLIALGPSIALAVIAAPNVQQRLWWPVSVLAGLWVLASLCGYVAGVRVRGWAASVAGTGLFAALFAFAVLAAVWAEFSLRRWGLRIYDNCQEMLVIYGVGGLLIAGMALRAYLDTARED
jgi:hypothetical protein